MSSNYLNLANTKFFQTKEIHWGLSLKEFICECYVKLNPCSYGNRIAEKIRISLDVYGVNPRDGIGDICWNDVYYEQKVSFLSNVNNSWSLTHLRPWQKFNYYIFCLIDCEDDFEPNFYVIDKMSINKFNLSAMNGTAASNHNNSNIELRTNIAKDSNSHKLLKRMNLLTDTSYDSLSEFVRKTK